MKALPLVSLAVVLAASAPTSDITIKTRTTTAPGAHAPIETVTVQLKGRRHRIVHHTDVDNGAVSFTFTEIAQCDAGRLVSINEAARTYVLEPARPIRPVAAPGVLERHAFHDTRPVVEVRTIDAVDTGERRSYGPFAARHVITTTTSERSGGAQSVTGVRDGWYIDLPRPDCAEPGEKTAVAVLSGAGRVELRTKGRAKTGFPIDERDRNTVARYERTTTLTEFSEAPIAASVFEIPDGYRPALQLPFGGYDLTRPDTLWNRASAYWSAASSWIRQWWR